MTQQPTTATNVRPAYALIVVSKEMRSGAKGNPIVTSEGEKFVVCDESDGWVEATSSSYRGSIPPDVKAFRSPAEAEAFAKKWKGHPWWCSPNGEYEIVELRPVFELQQIGWARCGN